MICNAIKIQLFCFIYIKLLLLRALLLHKSQILQ